MQILGDCHFIFQFCAISKGAILTSATVPWHWLFFALPQSHALKICLEIVIPLNILPKSLEASKWHWLILDLIGAIAYNEWISLKCTFTSSAGF